MEELFLAPRIRHSGWVKAALMIMGFGVLCSAWAEASSAAGPERIGDAWSDSRNPIVEIFGGSRLNLWSLQPIERPELPEVKEKDWPENPLDFFVLARLELAAIEPMPRADRRTLARRAYFDLTGLPPSPEELAEFLQDARPDAYERLVDRLLASPEYGEHWGRYWLDVVRYSDSNGFDWDEFRPLAWRFRDYVVRSFNGDKPFDQFVREQLAGDELGEGEPETPAEQDWLIATGYLRLGPHDNSAPLFNEQARSRAELMADLTETTASAFLGLTFSCNRCHDHKFDPFSQADHYRLRAFFEPVKFADDLPLDLAEEQERIREHNAGVEEKIKPLQKERGEILEAAKAPLRAERVAKLSEEERALLKKAEKERDERRKDEIEKLEKKVEPEEKEIIAAFSKEQKERYDGLSSQIEKLKKTRHKFTHGLLMVDGDDHTKATHILYQGDHKAPREPVEPGFLSVLDPNPAVIRRPPNPKSSGRRLALANWIVSPENPLTARVLVNRIWQGHFGEGLVQTANDFGLAGARPSNPELLDWLASEFIRSGWSIKRMHRLIMTSGTYQQASSLADRSGDGPGWRHDPGYHHVTLRRLSAEQLRDSLLLVSGMLQRRMGGGPVWPELPADVLQANPAFLDDNAEKTKGWYPSPENERFARSIYMVQKRTVRVPFMETFDLPENSTSCARRNESTVAPQALSLMNGPLAVEAARAFARRVEREAGGKQEAQVKRAFELAFQRPPAAGELGACLELLEERTLPELCRALVNANEFIYVD